MLTSASSRTAAADRKAFVATLALLAGLAVAGPLAVAAYFGALGIPRSDDWSYLVTLFRLVDSGSLSFNHWVSMSLVGQLVLAAPVAAVAGRDVGAVQTFTSILGFLGLVLVALMTTRVVRARWAGALVALTVAASPLWGPLTVSFMTDVPAFAMSALAMFLAIEGLRRRPVSTAWLGSSLVAALGAFTIRQYAIVTLMAGLLVGVWHLTGTGDRVRARRLLALGAVLLLMGVVFLAWWRSIPDVRSLSLAPPDAHSVRVTVIKGAGFLRLLGLLLLPVLAYAGPVALVRRSWRASPLLTLVCGAGATSWLLVVAWRVPRDLFVGNYMMVDGVLSDIVLIGRRPDVLPRPAWDLMVVIASAAGVVLAIATAPFLAGVLRRLRIGDWRIRDPIDAYLGTTIAGYAAAYGLAMATGLQVYDRYALPVLPAVALVLLRSRERAAATDPAAAVPEPARPSRGRVGAAIACLAALAFVGLAFTIDSASFDGARWRVALAATRQGWDPRQVNGGFEWLNYHRGEKPDRPRSAAPARSASGEAEGDARTVLCVTVHVNPRVVRTRVVAVVESWALTRPTARLVAFRTPWPCRPRRTASP